MDVYNATGEPQQGASRDGALPTGDLLGFTDQLLIDLEHARESRLFTLEGAFLDVSQSRDHDTRKK